MFTPCLFSISYGGLWGQAALGLPEFVRHAATLGYRHVMLAGKRPHLSPLDFDERAVEQLQATLHDAGVQAAVLGAYVDLAGGTARRGAVSRVANRLRRTLGAARGGARR